MKGWFVKFKGWRSRRGNLEYLARVKAEGPTRFILQGTMLYGLISMMSYDLFGTGIGMERAVIAHLSGALISWWGWHDIENRYQSALNEARQKAVMTAAPTNILGLRDS